MVNVLVVKRTVFMCCFLCSSHVHLQVYWIGPLIGAVLAGMSHEFFFAQSASRQKLVACLTCKDIDFVETTSITGSSLSTVTQNATRSKQNNKQENNWGRGRKTNSGQETRRDIWVWDQRHGHFNLKLKCQQWLEVNISRSNHVSKASPVYVYYITNVKIKCWTV